MSLVLNMVCGGPGGGGGPDKVMTQGRVSTTSSYAGTNFDESISGYSFVEVHMFRGGADVGYQVVIVPVSSTAFSIVGGGYTYTMSLTPTRIACTKYGGDYVNLYVDVFAYNAAE